MKPVDLNLNNKVVTLSCRMQRIKIITPWELKEELWNDVKMLETVLWTAKIIKNDS